jgi:hypothetical protein
MQAVACCDMQESLSVLQPCQHDTRTSTHTDPLEVDRHALRWLLCGCLELSSGCHRLWMWMCPTLFGTVGFFHGPHCINSPESCPASTLPPCCGGSFTEAGHDVTTWGMGGSRCRNTAFPFYMYIIGFQAEHFWLRRSLLLPGGTSEGMFLWARAPCKVAQPIVQLHASRIDAPCM